MAKETLAKVKCDACGQTDDHPMIHCMGAWEKESGVVLTAPSFHFDCLPDEFLGLLGDAPQHRVTIAARNAALNGTHGDDLRSFIQEQEDDNNVPDEEQYQYAMGMAWPGPGEADEEEEEV